MTTPFWTDGRKDLLNSRFTMQKQAEEIEALRAEVIKLNAMLNRERTGQQLQEEIEELRSLVIRQGAILADQAASIAEGDEVIDRLHAGIDTLQLAIDRAWFHLNDGHAAIARNVLAAHISQPGK